MRAARSRAMARCANGSARRRGRGRGLPRRAPPVGRRSGAGLLGSPRGRLSSRRRLGPPAHQLPRTSGGDPASARPSSGRRQCHRRRGRRGARRRGRRGGGSCCGCRRGSAAHPGGVAGAPTSCGDRSASPRRGDHRFNAAAPDAFSPARPRGRQAAGARPHPRDRGAHRDEGPGSRRGRRRAASRRARLRGGACAADRSPPASGARGSTCATAASSRSWPPRTCSSAG